MIARLYPGRIVHQVDQTHIKNVAFTDALEVARDLTARFEGGEFDVAHLFFAKFQSALVQVPTAVQLIPVAVPTAGAVTTRLSEDGRTVQTVANDTHLSTSSTSAAVGL